jgi:DNA-binding transcriptional LysR family regulator
MGPLPGIAPMSRVTITQLEAFVWIARLGSFHEAATRLNVSQPTVSLRMQHLETAVGRLLDRNGHRFTLTERGTLILEYADGIVSLSNRINAACAAPGDSRSVVRVGMPDSIAAACLSALVSRVAEVCPLVQLDISVDLSSTINRRLKDLSLDVAILAEPDVGPPVKLTPIGRNPLAWLAAPSIPLSDVVTPADLRRLRIITTPEYTHNYDVVMEWFASTQVTPARVSTCNNLDMIARLICDGIGVGALPLAMVQRELGAGRLVAFTCRPALRTRKLQAAYQTERPGAPIGAIESVVQVAREVLASKVPLLPMDRPA